MPDEEYPPPTEATVKELYGTAFRCAHPDCSFPLYRLSDETGDRVLNSRVAHIHARRRGGPRWIEMSPAENRGFDNLLLLCITHSYEIDDMPTPFEADTLRDWKAAQISEYESIQRNWPISDEEAAEVLVASESFDALHAPSTLELVRRAEALRLTAVRKREVVRNWAGAWNAVRERTRRQFLGMWDDEGNPVYVEPSEAEVRPMKDGIRSDLSAALAEVEPAADAARVELAAVRATGRRITPWCDDLERRIAELVTASSIWSGGWDQSADTEFEAAVAELQRSISDIVSASRGEPVDLPEPPPVTEERAEVDPLAEHRALLDEARPFHRVNTRPYDPALRERVATAMQDAAALPPTAHFMGLGVDVTASLAVAVAGNAPEAEKLELLERDRLRRPICAAAALLRATAEEAGESSPLVSAAHEHLRSLWRETDWASLSSWEGNEVNGRSMMRTFADVTSDDEVRDRLTDALDRAPELLEVLVYSLSGWSQQMNSRTLALEGISRTYREHPAWLPVQAMRSHAPDDLRVAEIADDQLPDALLKHFSDRLES